MRDVPEPFLPESASRRVEKFTVLVAEDEPLVRMVAVEELHDRGYEVIEVEDALEAIHFLEKNAPHIGLLFTDVHMPGEMDGLDLAKVVREKYPWINVLITSGKAFPSLGERPVGSKFLPKPYSLDKMAEIIQQIVAGF